MKAVTLREYMASECAPINYLVDKLIPKPGRICIVGPQKVGKSFMALQLALAVAQGTPFMGRVTQKGKVLYLQFDTPAPIWKERLIDLADRGVDLDGQVYLVRPEEKLGKVNIYEEGDRKRIWDLVHEIDPDLVIIDVLRKIHNGNENDSTDMKKVWDILNVLFEGRALVVLHHSFKINPEFGRPSASDAGRGSSFVAGEVDATWFIYQQLLTIDSRFDEAVALRVMQDPNTLMMVFPELLTPADDATRKAVTILTASPALDYDTLTTQHSLALTYPSFLCVRRTVQHFPASPTPSGTP